MHQVKKAWYTTENGVERNILVFTRQTDSRVI